MSRSSPYRAACSPREPQVADPRPRPIRPEPNPQLSYSEKRKCCQESVCSSLLQEAKLLWVLIKKPAPIIKHIEFTTLVRPSTSLTIGAVQEKQVTPTKIPVCANGTSQSTSLCRGRQVPVAWTNETPHFTAFWLDLRRHIRSTQNEVTSRKLTQGPKSTLLRCSMIIQWRYFAVT